MTTYKITKGVDIPLTGKPEKSIREILSHSILKIHPSSIKGIKPKLKVKEGEQVQTGSTLFFDKVLPGVNFVSPGTGTVKSIKFGSRRVIEEICIEISVNPEEFYETKKYSESEIEYLNKSQITKKPK